MMLIQAEAEQLLKVSAGPRTSGAAMF